MEAQSQGGYYDSALPYGLRVSRCYSDLPPWIVSSSVVGNWVTRKGSSWPESVIPQSDYYGIRSQLTTIFQLLKFVSQLRRVH